MAFNSAAISIQPPFPPEIKFLSPSGSECNVIISTNEQLAARLTPSAAPSPPLPSRACPSPLRRFSFGGAAAGSRADLSRPRRPFSWHLPSLCPLRALPPAGRQARDGFFSSAERASTGGGRASPARLGGVAPRESRRRASGAGQPRREGTGALPMANLTAYKNIVRLCMIEQKSEHIVTGTTDTFFFSLTGKCVCMSSVTY